MKRFIFALAAALLVCSAITCICFASETNFVPEGIKWTPVGNNTFYCWDVEEEDPLIFVKLVKPNYIEFYDICFEHNGKYFTVLDVWCADKTHRNSLKKEIGIKQYFNKNPRMNLVKKAVLKK